MARQVSPAEAAKMYELYQKLGTYAAVARAINRSPDTVSKYVKEYGKYAGVATTTEIYYGTRIILK